jgi:hypothetical protein
MGSLGAQAFAEQVEDGNVSLRAALSWHLRSNHFPPHPLFFIPLAEAAIEAGQDEDWDLELELPKGCVTHKTVVALDATNCTFDDDCVIEPVVQWRGREDGLVRAGDVIESFHLDSFL